MHVIFLLAMLWVEPFWETKAPKEWNDEDLLEMFHNSPWAQSTQFQNTIPIAVYLATAKPMRDAEEEAIRRYTSKQPGSQPPDMGARNEYLAYLEENPGKSIVLAIREPDVTALAEAEETRRMEKESQLKAGGKKYRMTGYFPPAGADPVLRLVFPRPPAQVKELAFDIYIPGITGPYRQASFRLKDLNYRGRPEY
ncbi:MAG: hypothetical protein JNK48_18260 [Bryobacterales bacterium]|nr:hypothetical protein [Bryobacterales bacterium]